MTATLTVNHNTKYLDATAFCRGAFPWKRKIIWLDGSGYIHLDSNRKAIIHLATQGTRQHYMGFSVRIVHKDNGEIDSKFISWAEHLPLAPQPANKGEHDRLEVIGYVGWQWYIRTPVSTMPIVKAIDTYLSIFA